MALGFELRSNPDDGRSSIGLKSIFGMQTTCMKARSCHAGLFIMKKVVVVLACGLFGKKPEKFCRMFGLNYTKKKNMTQDQALEILKAGNNVFLTGEPGTGKTYTINLFKEWLLEQGKSFQMTASTGIAATHLNGITIHSFLGIGLEYNVRQLVLDAIYGAQHIRNRLISVDVLIVDEVSMLDSVKIDDIDKVLRFIRQIDEPFGGVQIVFVGDFFQLPPIVTGRDGTGKKIQLRYKYAYESKSWIEANLKICYLTRHYRQDDADFLDLLSAIRTGSVTPAHKERLKKCRDNPMQLTELRSRNVDVDNINASEFAKLPGEIHTYQMEYKGDEELLKFLIKECLSPEVLQLKVGAVVMFTRNKYPDQGDVAPEDRQMLEPIWVNGNIGKVVAFSDDGFPEVEYEGGTIVVRQKESWDIRIKDKEWTYVRQLPLRLAFAITIHKSQGMSLDCATIDLRNTFVVGQGYVALSRVRSLDKIKLLGFNELALKVHPAIIHQDKVFRSQSQ